jgi:hypothetical protein
MILKIDFELLDRQESLEVRLSTEQWKRLKTDDINAFLGDYLGYYRAARATVTGVDFKESETPEVVKTSEPPVFLSSALYRQPSLVSAR